MRNSKKRYFRNWVEIEGIELDALWYLSATGDYVLVDDDQHIVADSQQSDNFYAVEDPFVARS